MAGYRSVWLCLAVFVGVTSEVGFVPVGADPSPPPTDGTSPVVTTLPPTTPPATAITTAPATTGPPTVPAGPTTSRVTGTAAGMTTGATTGNWTTNSTVTTAVPATTTTAPIPQSPRFQVNNSDGEPCMLLNFNATLTVNYTTTTGIQTARIPIMDTPFWEGHCNDTLRSFTMYYPNKETYCAFITLYFNMTSKTTYYNREGVFLRFIDPCFPDTTRYNTIEGGHFSPSYYGAVGKSYRCSNIERVSTKLTLSLVLEDILIQPFAQMSKVNGSYGEIETCPKGLPTTPVPPTSSPTSHPPTKPSPSKAGRVVGIIIGVVAVVGAIVALAVYVVRKRRYKAVTYGNLDETPPGAI